MGRRPILPLGRWGPVVLGLLALALVAWGAFSGNREMVALGGVAAAALLIGFPLAEFLMRGHDGSDEGP